MELELFMKTFEINGGISQPGNYFIYAEEDNPDLIVIDLDDVTKIEPPKLHHPQAWFILEDLREEGRGGPYDEDDELIREHWLDKYQFRGSTLLMLKPNTP
jgi:hypothetical protein